MDFKVGDFVKIAGQSAIGEVVGFKGSDLEVIFGLLKTTVKKNRVERIDNHVPDIDYPEEVKTTLDTKDKLMNFKFDLDLRGKMKDEVMVLLTQQIDDALLLGIKEFRIHHGRGNGTIKTTAKNVLRTYKEIKSIEDDSHNNGGEGITTVKL